MEEKVVTLANHNKGKAEVSQRPANQLFYAGVTSHSAKYLVEGEGEGLASILGEIDAGLMVRLFESDQVMGQVPQGSRPQVRELLRQLFENLEKSLRKKESTALPFIHGVERALGMLRPEAVVAVLRIFLAHILPKLSNRQLFLMSRAVMETVSSVDRWAIRSVLGDERLIRAAFERARLEPHDAEGSPFRVCKLWLSEWASMPLSPMVADDFEFFRRLVHQLPSKEILAEDEWRGLFRSLAMTFPQEEHARLNDRAFSLFRLLSRCAKRLPFVQYLLHSHGRALDMLGPELKDWILVFTLVDETRDLSKPFRLWLKPDMVMEEAGLEPDELKDFFEGLIEKMRLDRERFELDWFEQTSLALYSVISERERALEWRQNAYVKSETLASNIAADSSKKVSVSQLERVIRQVCDLVANAVTVAERPRDAKWHMALMLSMIVDFDNEGHIWRNGQRIAASLHNIASDQESEFAHRLHAALETLHQAQQTHSRIDESLGAALAQIDQPLSFLGCHLALFHASSQTVDNVSKSAHLIRDELLANRLRPPSLESESDDEVFYKLAILSGMGEAEARLTSEVLNQQVKLSDLWISSASLTQQATGEVDAAAQHLSEIARLMFMLPGNLVDRVDEEWAFWIAPELRPLSRIGYTSDAPKWVAFENRIKLAISPAEAPRVQVFFKRVLASKKKKRAQSDFDLQPYYPLRLQMPAKPGQVSEPFQSVVGDFIVALEKASAPQWMLDFARNLQELGDEERAWLAVYPSLLQALESHGQQTISAIFDKVMLAILEHLEPLSRAHWFEVLAEGRAITQQLAIGQVWLAESDSIAALVAPQVRAAMNNEPDLEKCIRDLGYSFEQMGKTLTEQTPVMAALELPRFWFQSVAPFVQYPPVLWRLVALALRDATQAHLAADMTVSVASWCHRFGEVAYKLAGSREFAAKTLQAKGNFFAENKRDEIAWRNFLSALLVTAAYGETGRLPRSLLCQRLLEVTPPLRNLNVDQWQGAAATILSKFRSQMDESILPGLVQSQAAVTDAFRFRESMKKMPNIESDVANWIRNRHKVGAQARWRRYVALIAPRFGVAHPAHVSVSQTLDWPLPDDPYTKTQTNLYKTVFSTTMMIRPDAIRVGLLKRRPPAITGKDVLSWRVRMIGYALGVAYGDPCCQRQCILVARLGPLRDWSFEAILELMGHVDGPIYINQSTHGSAEESRRKVLQDAWAASEISLQSTAMATETVLRWKPFGKAAEAENQRCIRDIGHVLKQIMLSCSGVQVNENLGEWYESHVLRFIGDSVKEPFAKLPAQLARTFRSQFPKSVADHLDNTTEPLRLLLEKD